jgi:hypothetical protein
LVGAKNAAALENARRVVYTVEKSYIVCGAVCAAETENCE